MATAKGLAAAAGKQLLGVSTLESLAVKCVTTKLVCAVLDARKKEVYASLYRKDESGILHAVGEIEAVSPGDLADRIEEPVVMVGDGAVVYRQVFSERLGDLLTMAPSALHEPSAASLGFLSAERHKRGEFLDLGSAVPLYVRSSDAELNLQKKQQAALAAVNKGVN
jgi:tRNA threonylcarbamoyladenosine biosynthesis protein TsaB